MTTSLVTNTLAVLAFVVGFYALLARERKTPYITNFLFSPAALLFVSIILESFSQLVQARLGVPKFAGLVLRLDVAATLFFYCGVIWVAKNIWRLHNRQVHFRDDNLLKNTMFVRWVRKTWRNIVPGRPPYEHNAEEVEPDFLRELLEKYQFIVPQDVKVKTIASCGESLFTADLYTTQIAAEWLRKGWLVQYTTCDRHPIEWVELLSTVLVNDRAKCVTRLAVVDGYTPHFGFTDSIHMKKSEELRKSGVSYVVTSESYAGVHTATAKAFNTFKRDSESAVRKPTLLIYEGCRALVDLESIEQYRIFLRHVITSERMWGSMLTFFIEPEADDKDLKLISAYADCLRDKSEEEAE